MLMNDEGMDGRTDAWFDEYYDGECAGTGVNN